MQSTETAKTTAFIAGWRHRAGAGPDRDQLALRGADDQLAARRHARQAALGLRIVRADGTQLSFGRATARHFLKFMITPLVPLAIGYLMAAFTDRKRALHDVLADTLVIRSP